ncbi:MAG: aminoacyl-tRNA hydrolase [Alphaproteobacteria bacterium]|nr:aminoacyl-tRNA hydrolase [Alphaproteobacteria bacterium]HCP01809.1 aminoacyl-tRNA hydrolase [Rhodospirillaceae bacterium]
MRLVVGLGNPGPKHKNNRHNIGFMAADEIVRRHNLSAPRNKFQGDISEGHINGERVVVLKPATFMNESGRAVGEAMRFYKLAPENIVVIYDEIDLAAAKLRVKQGGGHAGHNGLRSIDAHLNNRNYWRVRLGIGHPGDKTRVKNHVLGDFSKADQSWLKRELCAVADELPVLLDQRASDFMSRVTMKIQGTGRSAAQLNMGTAQPERTGPQPTSIEKDRYKTDTVVGSALSRAMNRLRRRD